MTPRWLLLALFLMSCKSPAPLPPWAAQELRLEGDFVLSPGRGEGSSEPAAKDAALSDAVERFVRYCRVDVDTFDRIEETYSSAAGESSTIESRSLVRAKAFVSRAIPDRWHLTKEGRRHRAAVLLKIPKSELERISSQKDVKLSVDIAVHQETSSGDLVPLEEGAVLRSGDGYSLYLRPSDTSFLYVFQVDALGKSARLFPNPAFKTSANPVAAGSELWVPNGAEVLVLDEVTGKERLFIFGSREPIAELEKASELEIKDLDELVSIKKMGVASTRAKVAPDRVPSPRKPSAVAEVKRKLQAQGEFVYETWFWHR